MITLELGSYLSQENSCPNTEPYKMTEWKREIILHLNRLSSGMVSGLPRLISWRFLEGTMIAAPVFIRRRERFHYQTFIFFNVRVNKLVG